jgi:hypothetical protein
MFSTSNELVVPTSRAKLVTLVVGSVAFVVAGAWMLTNAEGEGWFVGTVGVATVTFFGACGAYAMFRIARPTPAVVINLQGIVDNASAVSVGFIRWDEIDQLREYRFQNQVFLGIVPRNLDAILARQPAWKRSAIRANLRLGAAPVNIPQAVLPMRVSDLLHEINVRFRRDSDA